MADEISRVIKRKRIKLPSGDTIDIPVVYQITFADPSDRGQEQQLTIDNTTDSDRDVRIASIPGDGEPTDETGAGGAVGDPTRTLQVERIDKFRLFDAPDRGRETFPEPDSRTVAQPPNAPPYFTTHEKTHIVKYIRRNQDDNTEDSSAWIKSELIDVWTFIDAPDRGQETKWTFSNPPDNKTIDGLRFGTDTETDKNGVSLTTISVDPSVEEITSGVGGSGVDDKPVRTDPFQNIVDFSSGKFVIGCMPILNAGKAGWYTSTNGFDWKPHIDEIIVGTVDNDSEIFCVAGGHGAFYIAAFGQKVEGGQRGIVKVSTDNGNTFSNMTPDEIETAGIFRIGWFDNKPADDPDTSGVIPKAFRIETNNLSGNIHFWSSYDRLKTWTDEGPATPPALYPSWGSPPHPCMARGKTLDPDNPDAVIRNIFIYAYGNEIFMGEDDQTSGEPPDTKFPDPPDLGHGKWTRMYSAPPIVDGTDEVYQILDGGSRDPGNGTMQIIAKSGVTQHTNADGSLTKGSTFVVLGYVRRGADSTRQWTNLGPLPEHIALVTNSLGDLVYEATTPDGFHLFYTGFTIDGLAPVQLSPPPPPNLTFPDGTPVDVGWVLVQTAFAAPGSSILVAPYDLWVPQTMSSGEDIVHPIVYVSVGGYKWKFIELTESNDLIAFAGASNNPETQVANPQPES